MEEHEKIELRSEEVQEILGTPPGSIVRWGTTVAFLSVCLMGLVSYLIKYPDKIRAPILLTTLSPPVKLIARSNGYLSEFNVENREQVDQNQILIVMKSTADYQDVLSLDSIVNEIKFYDKGEFLRFQPPIVLELGDLQLDYSAFTQSFEDFVYVETKSSGFGQQNKTELRQQIQHLKDGINNEKKKLRQTLQELGITAKRQKRYKKDYENRGGISLNQLEAVALEISSLKRKSTEIETSISDKQTSISVIRKQMIEIDQGFGKNSNENWTKLKENIRLLRSKIEDWKQTYLLTTPISGVASFHSYWKEQQFVQAGETVLSIVPIGGDSIVGTIFMPVKGSGKVKKGLNVIIKMDGYPYEEYGSIRGKVAEVSEVPQDQKFRVVVNLPNGLLTSHKKKLPFSQEMQGSAEIITEKKRFIEKVFEELLGRFENFR